MDRGGLVTLRSMASGEPRAERKAPPADVVREAGGEPEARDAVATLEPDRGQLGHWRSRSPCFSNEFDADLDAGRGCNADVWDEGCVVGERVAQMRAIARGSGGRAL